MRNELPGQRESYMSELPQTILHGLVECRSGRAAMSCMVCVRSL